MFLRGQLREKILFWVSFGQPVFIIVTWHTQRQSNVIIKRVCFAIQGHAFNTQSMATGHVSILSCLFALQNSCLQNGNKKWLIVVVRIK